MSHRPNRRDFLRYTTLTGAGVWVAGTSTNSVQGKEKSPNERLQFACIGVGGKGSSDTDQAANFGDIVAICDVDENSLNQKVEKKFPSAKRYFDFRKLLDEMGNKIDAVTVSTPDHTHAVAAVMAMKMGKHVYCQKPLTHSVYEARVMRETARKHRVATQMGNQGTTENGLREAVEVIRSGAIGPAREVHVWTNRPVWPQSPKVTSRPKAAPIPNHVHWYEWLGPAPDRPYALYPPEISKRRGAYHAFNWRGWWDFGTGALGDMGCHTANMPFMALKLGYPTSVVAENEEVNPETCPAWATVTYQFPEREQMPPVKFVWHEGKLSNGKKNLPPEDLLYGEKPPGSGCLIVGDKGTLYSPNDYGAGYKLFPAKEFEGYQPPKPTLPRNGKGDTGQKEEWVSAIREGSSGVALSNFGYAGLLTEAILLGNVAIRVGKKIDWDGEYMKAKNCPEADPFIRREYREGWTL